MAGWSLVRNASRRRRPAALARLAQEHDSSLLRSLLLHSLLLQMLPIAA